MNRLSQFACFAAVLGCMANASNASFISRSPDPLLEGNLVSQGTPILSPFGYVTFNIANITQISNRTDGVNGFITYSASPILSFYSDPALTNLVTSATFQGQFEIEVLGRTNPFQTGTFSFRFLSSTASGTVMGTPVTVQLSPNQVSGGTTTITAGPGVGQFTIDTTATQYSQFSIAGSPFADIPALPLVGVAAVPEPASLTMLATAFLGLGIVAYRRRA